MTPELDSELQARLDKSRKLRKHIERLHELVETIGRVGPCNVIRVANNCLLFCMSEAEVDEIITAIDERITILQADYEAM